MRIAVAEIAQETDSFSPLTADLQDFKANGLYFGREILGRMSGIGPIGGFLEVAAQQRTPVEVSPIIRAWGGAGGTIREETLAFLAARLVEGLKQSLPLDGVFLSLHGAAASEKEDDVEGFLLQAAREVVGDDIPVVVALDHHANITQKMVDQASVRNRSRFEGDRRAVGSKVKAGDPGPCRTSEEPGWGDHNSPSRRASPNGVVK